MRKLITALTMIVVAAVTTVIIQSPAQAAGTCFRTIKVRSQAGSFAGSYIPSTGSTATSTTCYMAQGANSDAVWRLQWTLNKCYYRAGASPLFPALLDLDGDFGPKTKSALTYAQRLAGANPDGGYGPETETGSITTTATTAREAAEKSSPHQQLSDSATINTMRQSSRIGLHT